MTNRRHFLAATAAPAVLAASPLRASCRAVTAMRPAASTTTAACAAWPGEIDASMGPAPGKAGAAGPGTANCAKRSAPMSLSDRKPGAAGQRTFT